ncbi:hypothetical protein E1B28_002338 [Marasmius oreades]|uniref:Uncharacterized protein n=1 Tax=Marasmius oreades TaxID=181124 RepID=A0A9P7RMF6_9AGAR|nr:uncharacterized protein E1B28_002338 [Marasmius oreades]KAG7086381.1 hypothetical protein E1B28_002338 [Marasmius oreades]
MPSSSDESSSSGSTTSVQKKWKGKMKGKGKVNKEKSTDKSQDPSWAYKPPHKYSAMKDVHDEDEWDWDTFQGNKDLELWLIRVPDGVKPQHLENVSIQGLSNSKDPKLGTISSKQGKYDIYEYRDADPPVGGEEIKNISCLLPRRGKKDELRLAPRPIARRLVVSSHEVKATPIDDEAAIELMNPRRFSYSKEMLTHKFMPYGSHLPTPPEDVDMDVEEIQARPPEPEPKKPKNADGSRTKGKRKKMAEETSSPKKSKKVKRAK